MTILNTTKILTASIAIASVLWACDDIAPEDRYIHMPAVESQRVVLLEEFTGQKCLNCPNAHASIHALLQQYPDNLIAVSIHAGGTSNTYGEGEYSSIVGLRNDEGEAYADAWSIISFPQGVVNRRVGPQTMDLWGGSIRSEVKRPASLDLAIDAITVAPDGKSLEVTTTMTPHANITGHLQLWVVESGIVARQKLPDGSFDNKYVHDHVFRASVNGHDGEPVALTNREPLTVNHTVALRDHWTTDNLSIVAFVYTSEGVEQAAERAVVAPTQE